MFRKHPPAALLGALAVIACTTPQPPSPRLASLPTPSPTSTAAASTEPARRPAEKPPVPELCRDDLPEDITKYGAIGLIDASPFAIDRDASVNPRLPPQIIQSTVRAGYDVFRRCYEAGLSRNMSLSGKVTVQFVIERDGSVRNARTGCTTMPDDEVVRCIVAAYRTLKFPPPEGGIVTVVYPINFDPGD